MSATEFRRNARAFREVRFPYTGFAARNRYANVRAAQTMRLRDERVKRRNNNNDNFLKSRPRVVSGPRTNININNNNNCNGHSAAGRLITG